MKLGKDDAAIIIKKNMRMEMVIPRKHGNTIVSGNVLVASALITLWDDKQFSKLINKQIKKICNIMDEEEKNKE